MVLASKSPKNQAILLAMSADEQIRLADAECLEETVDVIGNAALIDDIREALTELGTAGAPILTKADALRLIATETAV